MRKASGRWPSSIACEANRRADVSNQKIVSFVLEQDTRGWTVQEKTAGLHSIKRSRGSQCWLTRILRAAPDGADAILEAGGDGLRATLHR